MWVHFLYVPHVSFTYLVHGEIGEENHHVFLHADYETSVALVLAFDHLHVVAHAEILAQLIARKLKWFLQEQNINSVYNEKELQHSDQDKCGNEAINNDNLQH